jgi:hypothetical protein
MARVEFDGVASAAVRSAARIVVPLPAKGSRTMSSRLVTSTIASATMAMGLTVG